MKYKTTQKAIKENYNKIIKVGYCNLQSLLKSKTPKSYTYGALGWNADIYDINGIAIVTGYRPFGNIEADYKTCQKYEAKAEKLDWYELGWEEYNKQINELLKQFIEEVKQ